MAYVRTVRTSSGAVAVQVVWKSRHGSRDIEHLGSAHTDAEVEVLKGVAAQRIADDVKVARLEPVSAPHVAQQVRRDAAVRSRAARAVGPLEPVACEGWSASYSGLTCSQRRSISAASPGPCRSSTAALLGGALSGLTLGVFERYLRRKGRTE